MGLQYEWLGRKVKGQPWPLELILPQNALKRDCNGKCIEWIEGHYLEVVVLLYL